MTGAPSPDLRLVTRAIAVAAEAHAGQRRRAASEVPYINHPVAVVALLAEAGAPAATLAAGALHDVVEDCGVPLERLEREFGAEVARLVGDVTDGAGRAALPRRERKAAQAAHIAGCGPESRRLKLADQTANLRDIAREPGVWKRAAAETYIEGAERVAAACAGIDPHLDAAFAEAVRAGRAALTQAEEDTA